MKKNTKTKVSKSIKWGGLCVMLVAGFLVAQENSGQPASGQQPNAAQQLNYGFGTANSKVGIRDARTFTFASANTSGIFSPVNVTI